MKKFIILLVLVIILGGLYYSWKFFEETREENVINEMPSPGTEKILANTEDKIGYIVENIVPLAKDFDTDVPFTVQRAWAHEGNFYIEYINKKGILGQILVTAPLLGGISVIKDSIKGVGYFTPSESGWALQAGEGDLAGPEAFLYEKDSKGRWIKKN